MEDTRNKQQASSRALRMVLIGVGLLGALSLLGLIPRDRPPVIIKGNINGGRTLEIEVKAHDPVTTREINTNPYQYAIDDAAMKGLDVKHGTNYYHRVRTLKLWLYDSSGASLDFQLEVYPGHRLLIASPKLDLQHGGKLAVLKDVIVKRLEMTHAGTPLVLVDANGLTFEFECTRRSTVAKLLFDLLGLK